MESETEGKDGKTDLWRLAKILAVVVVLPWMLLLGIGIIVAACGGMGVVGSLGDSFGIINSLFSALAFGAVALTLYQQESDSKNANIKHREILDRQQDLFEQNAKIALFDKRYEASRAVFDLVKSAIMNPDFSHVHVEAFDFISLQALYLFPDIPDLDTKLVDLSAIADSLVMMAEKINGSTSEQDKAVHTAVRYATITDFAERGKQINLAFEKYLLMPTPPKTPIKP